MNRLHKLDDIQLAERVQRLRHDVEDFQTRARKESAALECAGRSIVGDPLHQRLTSILTFLRDELANAEAEVQRRTAAAAVQPRRPLKEAILDALQSITLVIPARGWDPEQKRKLRLDTSVRWYDRRSSSSSFAGITGTGRFDTTPREHVCESFR